ncbi:hypothetical protein A6R68_07400 [Neotoma lepida]|uniref:tRNA (carboxymethyluridine(34)-5-O)-methyltransferase ALKBH8 n=1 Tax=Neotoma lepida TaxID=56216 RepID=A0A1A6GCU3_NEOLE|nr:hypothetical protein A6R68_07400 [Neotoma lepida]
MDYYGITMLHYDITMLYYDITMEYYDMTMLYYDIKMLYYDIKIVQYDVTMDNYNIRVLYYDITIPIMSITMNINHKGGLKLNKIEKKFLRKQSKARHVLLKHEGIQAVSYPTQSLVVANGGLGNGVSRKQLLLALEECGPMEALLMPPNKPYAFVIYKTIEESRKAYATINGKEIIDDLGQKIILYLNFVEKAQWKKLGLQALPPGLLVVEEIISPEDEKMLLEIQKSLKHRRVKHFGYEFHYENNTVDKDKPLPGGIPAHIDTHSAFEDEIISLSLGSEIVMDFKHPEGITIQVMLPRRSLLVMTGESRYLWTHGITPRKFDTVQASEQFKGGIITSDIGDLTLSKRGTRTSFTFRKVRRVPCNCSKSLIPSVLQENKCESSKEAWQLEREHVHRVYDLIARHFSSTRHSPWPRIVEFLKALPSGSIIGCDRSRNLVDICRERQFQALVCDALSVPFRSGSFDACISIAVIHHFSTADRRVAALQELSRLLRPGGQALIYVWAMEQEYKNQKSKYLRGSKTSQEDKEEINSDTITTGLLVNQMPDGGSEDQASSVPLTDNIKEGECKPRKVPNSELPVHTNRTSFHSQDVLVPWHLKGNSGKDKAVEPFGLAGCPDPSPVFHRYYHVFCDGELEASCQALGDVSVLQSYYDQGNWCVVLQKF